MKRLLLLALLSFSSFQAQAEPTPAQDWIDLASLKAGFVFDLRYGNNNNFTGEILYPVPKAFLSS